MLYSEVGVASGPPGTIIGSSIQNWSTYYGYDADGNRLETDGGDFLNGQGDEEQASFWTYNANNELHQYQQYNPDQDNPSVTTTTYTYDANGNEVEADSTTEHQQQEDGDGNDSFQFYTYDVRGEMVKYVDPNNQTTTYTYDDAGNRVKEVTPVSGHNVTTTYLADPENPQGYAQTIEEHINGAAIPAITYFVGLRGTQGQTSGSTIIYMLRDNRGYSRVLTNASGTPTQDDQFDAYGNQMTFNVIPTTHYFADGTLDPASGLTFHFGGRQSSTVNGDFIEQDQLRFIVQGDPQTTNLYTLDAADPLSHIDPSGHFTVQQALFIAGIGAAIYVGYRINGFVNPPQYYPPTRPTGLMPGFFKVSFASYDPTTRTFNGPNAYPGFQVQYVPVIQLGGTLKLVQAVKKAGVISGNFPHIDLNHEANNPTGVAAWQAHLNAPQGGPLPDYASTNALFNPVIPNNYIDTPVAGSFNARYLFTTMAVEEYPDGSVVFLGAMNFEYDSGTGTTTLANNVFVNSNNQGPVRIGAANPGWVWDYAFNRWQQGK